MRKRRHSRRARAAAKGAAAGGRRTAARRVLSALPAIAAAAVLVTLFNGADSFRALEKKLLDAQMRWDVPGAESDVAVVEITEEDYYQLFGGASPLDPPRLRRLIGAIAAAGPCVIGVDISTFDPPFREMETPGDWPPVVWVRDVWEDAPGADGRPTPRDVLGGRDPALNRDAGLALLIKDGAGVTRRYRRVIETADGRAPSFPWAVYQSTRRNCPHVAARELEETTDSLNIGYARGAAGLGRTRLPASQVLAAADDPDWRKSSGLEGKIVLVGGSYSGQDTHDTPLGRMPGVVIMANAVETELRGGGRKSPGYLALGLFVVFDGLLMVMLFDDRRSLKKSLLLSLPVILALALASSLLAYRSPAQFPYFALIMVGVVAYELLGRVKKYFQKRLRGSAAEAPADGAARR